MALISLGTLVVACRQVVVGGGRWKGGGMDGWRDEGWDEHRATLTNGSCGADSLRSITNSEAYT